MSRDTSAWHSASLVTEGSHVCHNNNAMAASLILASIFRELWPDQLALVDLETGENVTDDPTPDITISQMGDDRPGFSHRFDQWWCGCAIILRDLKQETTDLQISQRKRPQVLHRPAPVRAGAARRIVINISSDTWHHVTYKYSKPDCSFLFLYLYLSF